MCMPKQAGQSHLEGPEEQCIYWLHSKAYREDLCLEVRDLADLSVTA